MNTDSVGETPTAASVDPRVRRTHHHILGVTRELLEEREGALTFSRVAERAQVARQTLYTHWGTIEGLIADTIVVSRTRNPREYDGLSARERAKLFGTELIETMGPASTHATAAIIAALHYDLNAAAAFDRLFEGLFEIFTESVGPVTKDQFIELVSPLVLTILVGSTVSPQLLSSMSERASQFIR